MLSTFVPIYVGSQVNFGESIRTVQEDLARSRPSIFLACRASGKTARGDFHQDAGAGRQSARGPARRSGKVARAHGWRERWTHALWYWLVLRALQNFHLRRVRVAMTGAAPIPPDGWRYFRNIGVPLLEVYGLTESSGMIFGQHPDRVKVGTVGEPIARGWRVANCRCAATWCSRAKNPQATADTVRDGWLHTGDVVAVQGGRVRIVDRMKDIMITRRQN